LLKVPRGEVFQGQLQTQNYLGKLVFILNKIVHSQCGLQREAIPIFPKYNTDTSVVSTEKIHRKHRISHDKLVWCLQRGFICYTGLVVIN
jgi:hypothetical protein